MLAKVKKSGEKVKNLSDNELKHLTVEFKDRYQSGESLDSLLPDAFAAIVEADERVLGKDHMMFRFLQEQPYTRDILQR